MQQQASSFRLADTPDLQLTGLVEPGSLQHSFVISYSFWRWSYFLQ
jgi:hypothetical protein